MTNQWYYGRGADVSGPVSSKELSELAVNGQVLPTDTIWRDDIEAGVPAANVKNLFPNPEPPAGIVLQAAADSSVSPNVLAAPVETEPKSEKQVVSQVSPTASAAFVAPPAPQVTPPRPARASAGTGALIVSQDGKTVKYRGKCTTCGREDTSWKSMAIPRGTTRTSFFCSKCRKRRDIEVHGYH